MAVERRLVKTCEKDQHHDDGDDHHHQDQADGKDQDQTDGKDQDQANQEALVEVPRRTWQKDEYSYQLNFLPERWFVLALVSIAGPRWLFGFFCIAAVNSTLWMLCNIRSDSYKLWGFGGLVPLNDLHVLDFILRKEAFLSMFAGSTLYAVYASTHACLAMAFAEAYALSEWQAALTYLPIGLGCTVSTLLFRRVFDALCQSPRSVLYHPDSAEWIDENIASIMDFDWEKSYLPCMWIPAGTYIASLIAFGWAVETRVNIQVPLGLLFLTGIGFQTCLNIYHTLRGDMDNYIPTKMASPDYFRPTFTPICVLAMDYMTRYTFAALVVSLQPFVKLVGAGLAFTALGSLGAISVVAFVVQYHYGRVWRVKFSELSGTGPDGEVTLDDIFSTPILRAAWLRGVLGFLDRFGLVDEE